VADLYFSTINRNPKAYLFAIVGAEHVLRLLPAGTHDYEKFIRPSELALWLREAGLQLESMTGLTYNPLTKRYRLVADRRLGQLHAAREQTRLDPSGSSTGRRDL
jgi:2-polyprenyl-6-hydroxyphenyl methylase/3-demethylubiquinone-9 3-methyltransferase